MADATRDVREPRQAKFSIPSIIAIVAAIISFFLHAGWGLVLAGVAILFGIVGFVMALAPGIRGGVVSVVSMFAGGAGILVAVIKLLVPG